MIASYRISADLTVKIRGYRKSDSSLALILTMHFFKE